MTREHYIPFNKEFLLEQQIAAFAEDKQKADDFKKLFEIIEHYYHYESFNLNRNLKQNYALYDPDLSEREREGFIDKSDFSIFKNTLLTVLERGNYYRISEETLKEAFQESDLIGLNLTIDFNAFKDYELYARGHHKAKEKIKKYFFWKKEVEIEYYDRVLIYLNYSDADYLAAKKVKLGKMPIDPGSIALKIFKRVPKNDLETIFPNAVPKMSFKDKMLLWVPGVFGGISLLSAKVIPALLNMYEARLRRIIVYFGLIKFSKLSLFNYAKRSSASKKLVGQKLEMVRSNRMFRSSYSFWPFHCRNIFWRYLNDERF